MKQLQQFQRLKKLICNTSPFGAHICLPLLIIFANNYSMTFNPNSFKGSVSSVSLNNFGKQISHGF